MSNEENENDVEVTDGELSHIGIKRRSGRYPWGSGKDPLQRAKGFQSFYEDMTKNKGLTDKQICEHLNKGVENPWDQIQTTELRATKAQARAEVVGARNAMVQRLRDKGMSPEAIAKRMSTPEKTLNESTVRGWIKQMDADDAKGLKNIVDVLKAEVETKPYLDVGSGVHLHLGISETKLKNAVLALQDEGYAVHRDKIPQQGTGQETNARILAKPGTPWVEVHNNLHLLQNPTVHSADMGQTFTKPSRELVSLDSKRLQIRYDEDGGSKMDGVIEVRRGVPELDLGASRYAQVRVAVDGKSYLKGMAIYATDLPDGVDVRFNTNKSKNDPKIVEGGKHAALKELKKKEDGSIDMDQPFGASTYPKTYLDKSGKEKTSPLAIVNDEGKWDDWSKTLSSQMLSKQPVTLARSQLKKTQDELNEEFSKIKKLTNPVVREKLLQEFSDKADAHAVDLKASALDRQATKVILPMNSMRPGEVFAPGFKDGERVALVRYPHGGKFEIPELVVNNRNLTAKKIMGGALDAIGIHHSVAERLSGADFDGDTVLIIPNDSGKVKSQNPLSSTPLGQLKNFDPKRSYPEIEGMKYMTKQATQREMGRVSNLITDMTIKGANDDDIAAAVRHSMVVIDAEKHKLNYKQSELDNGIARLKEKYQGKANGGASTIISRASSEDSVKERRLARQGEGGSIDPKTGELRYVDTGRSYVQRKKNPVTGEWEETGKVIDLTTKGTKMGFAKDAHSLTSGPDAPLMEKVYADHANSMKALGNQARLELLAVRADISKTFTKSKAAEVHYAEEVKSLQKKLKLAQSNAPLERQAQTIALGLIKARLDANPHYNKDEIKRVRFQALDEGRLRAGAGKLAIGSKDSPLTQREWDAIQARAVSPTMLRNILANADMQRVRELSTPRPTSTLTTGQQARIRQLKTLGRSAQEIADALGIPRSTVSDHMREGG